MTDESKIRGPWTLIEEHTYEDCGLFQLRRSRRTHTVRRHTIDFFRVDGFDWVTVIPMTASGEVVLVEQYRHGTDALSLETPGGVIDPGESPEVGARREMEEETGYSSPAIELLGSFHPNAAMFSLRCHAFLARDAAPAKAQELDEGEDIEVSKKPMAEVLHKIRAGEITHGIVLAAFALLTLKHPELVR